MSEDPKVGIRYVAREVTLLSSHSIPDGVEYMVTNVDGDRVSLSLYRAHFKDAPSKITIYKPCFGQCFEFSDPFQPLQASYAAKNHFYEPVSSSIWIFTSRMTRANA